MLAKFQHLKFTAHEDTGSDKPTNFQTNTQTNYLQCTVHRGIKMFINALKLGFTAADIVLCMPKYYYFDCIELDPIERCGWKLNTLTS